jgi:hypothetical protein
MNFNVYTDGKKYVRVVSTHTEMGRSWDGIARLDEHDTFDLVLGIQVAVLKALVHRPRKGYPKVEKPIGVVAINGEVMLWAVRHYTTLIHSKAGRKHPFGYLRVLTARQMPLRMGLLSPKPGQAVFADYFKAEPQVNF